MMAVATDMIVPPPAGHKHVAFAVSGEADNQNVMHVNVATRPTPSVSFQSDLRPRSITHQLSVVPEGEEFEEILREIDKDLEKGNEADAEEEENEDEEKTLIDDHEDPVFEKIKEKVEKSLERTDSATSLSSAGTDESDGKQILISEHYTSIPFGIQPRATYEHGKKNADIMGLAYNSRMRQFIILDSKGITSWKRDNVDNRVMRNLLYPKYEYRLLTYLVYAKKYNCYFALSKDFSLKVLNRDFDETCHVSAGLRSVLFMVFNSVTDELITGGVDGTKIWSFRQVAGSSFMELKPLANYELHLEKTLENVGGSWVKKVELDHHLQHLYFCSDTDLQVYNLQGKRLFKYEKAHTMSITGCVYSQSAKVLITSSVDCEVKVWSLMGGLVHSFRGHSRAVTNLLLHPDSSSLIITASLDGSIRMWSLDTMELVYNITVSSDGVLWMGLTDDNILYVSTCRNITLWSLNQFYSFWALSRNRVTNLSLSGHEGKTTRVVSLGDDSSVRLFNRKTSKNLTTVLPPHVVPPLQSVMSVCYSREFDVVFLLINPQEIWVYTSRTDPSCRIAVWNVHDIQMPYITGARGKGEERGTRTGPKGIPLHRATENGTGNEVVCNCYSLCDLNSSATMWTDEGNCCPIRHTYLLLGMEDGRILFMDPVIRGQKYMEFKANKDKIQMMKHDVAHEALITMCQMADHALFQMWDLPNLTLKHEVCCGQDVHHFTRLDYSFLTGHQSGAVYFHYLLPAEESMTSVKSKGEDEEQTLEEKDVGNNGKKLDHNSPIVGLDASTSLRIFCSASLDGALKIWDEFCVLLTEITMEESLSALCFLNAQCDLLVGFQNHIYFIDHTKVCPYLKLPSDEGDYDTDTESDIYENPDVLYEGGLQNTDELTLETYLVPYKLQFSQDFLEGKLPIEQKAGPKEEDKESSESESDYSLAATDTYLSPPDSPSRLSEIDLTLGSGYTKYDLLKQMNRTMRTLALKQKAEAKRNKLMKKGKRLYPKRGKKRVNIMLDDDTPLQSDIEDGAQDEDPFTLPMFGMSPGPTPPGTPPSKPATPVDWVPHIEGTDIVEDKIKPEKAVPEPVAADLDPFQHLAPEASIEYIPPQNTLDILPADSVPEFSKKNIDYDIPNVLDSDDRTPVTLIQSVDIQDEPDNVTEFKSEFFGTETENDTERKDDISDKPQVGISSESEYQQEPEEKSTEIEVKHKTDNDFSIIPALTCKSKMLVSRNDGDDDDDLAMVLNEIKKEKGSSLLSTIRLPQPEEDIKGRQLREEETFTPVEKTRPRSEHQYEEEEEEVPRRRSKYSLANARVDVKGLMRPQSKRLPRRFPSPSPSRRESDHSHTTLTEEDLKRLQQQEKEMRKKQMKDRKFPKKGQKMTRQELIEQQRLQQEMQKKKYDVPAGYKPRAPDRQKEDGNDGSYPMVMFQQEDIDNFQDMMWDPEPEGAKQVGLMGTKLDLPPARKPMEPPRPIKPIVNRPGAPPAKSVEQLPPSTEATIAAEQMTREETPVQLKTLDLPMPQYKPPEPKPASPTKDVDKEHNKGLDHKPAEEEKDRENLSPDVETALQRRWEKGEAMRKPVVPAPQGTLKKLSEQRKAGSKPIKVILPRENDAPQDPHTLQESPMPEITEEDIEKYMKALDSDPEEEDDIEIYHGAFRRMSKTKRSIKDGGVLMLEEKKIIRPYSSVTRRDTPEAKKDPDRVRPKTAQVHFHANDLQNAFDDAFDRYQGMPGTPAALTKNKLYRNDSTNFESNWQERAIERHMLLRMQKELRCKSAAQKRQAWESQRGGAKRMMSSREVISDDPTQDLVQSGSTSARSDTYTVAAKRELGRLSSLGMHSPGPPRYSATPLTPVPQRPQTAFVPLPVPPTVANKSELKTEKPFRFVMGKNGPPSVRPSPRRSMVDFNVEPKMIDPRNPSRTYRPSTSRSIPSKCSRYMLVSRPKEKTNFPLPSPIEEQLLADRFPNLGMQVYRHHSDIALRSKKVSYCIEYTPYGSCR
ncbi:uncharacterized protein LOC117331705 isoform X2 [Pecten maximus]|uniref:uncharacterized protein LOC117331705 isoform X2 n=1 Tax=Pecten maximus TaxID=6579 RepID=UPI00145916B2|nr:uncharacterized protein LOC117331705 isoform X2 [Pecten maximus]